MCYECGLLKYGDDKRAFTIVELLVVIVIIGILASITFVAYTGVANKASIAALQSDLSNSYSKLKVYSTDNSAYPVGIDCNASPAANTICLKPSNNASYTYQPTSTLSPQSYTLYETSSNGTIYMTTDNSSPVQVSKVCPTNYVFIPGSSTYGTSDFCVMKYEAKIQGQDDGNQTYSASFVAESRPDGTPWVNISQTNAIAEASALGTGYHLITEAEWMTIAQNVLSVPINWSGGSVGNGYIYSGHNDGTPNNSLAASSDDNNGYYGTGNFAGDTSTTNSMIGNSQRRTLKLTTGATVWDTAGDTWDWTSGQQTGGQPGISGSGYSWREWKNLTVVGSLAVNPFPSGTGLAGSDSWTRANGIGAVYSSADETAQHAIERGGGWSDAINAGILYLNLYKTPSDAAINVGFRVSR